MNPQNNLRPALSVLQCLILFVLMAKMVLLEFISLCFEYWLLTMIQVNYIVTICPFNSVLHDVKFLVLTYNWWIIRKKLIL